MRLGRLLIHPIVWLATLVAFGAAPGAAQQPSFGPLTYEEGAPLQRVSYTAMTEEADVIGRNRWRVDVWNGFSNIFEQDSTDTHNLFFDMERLVSVTTLRWGASETLEVGGRLTLETTGTGALDGIILDWHAIWGFGNANRDRFPEGEYRQSLTDGNGGVFLDVKKKKLALQDVRAFAKLRVARSSDGRSVLSLKSELRAPLTGPLEGNENVDLALAALGRLGAGAWYLHGMLGASFTRVSPELDPVLRGGTRYLMIAAERSLGSSLAAVLQFDVQTAALESFQHRELDRAPTNFTLGLAGRLGEQWSWDASFQEDLPSDTPAVDFTIGLRLSRVW